MAKLDSDKEQKFKEVLDSLRLIAQAQENVISEKEVRESFAKEDITLSKEQFELVLNFLKQEEVRVSSSGKQDILDFENTTPEERDEQFYQMYKRDLRSVKKSSKEELEELMTDMEGNRGAIMESFLRDVTGWVEPYRDYGLMMCDLVQEGNLALVEALPHFSGSGVAQLRKYLKEAVVKAVLTAIDEQEGQDNVAIKVLGRVNSVNDCAREMAQELGRKATFAEVAAQLNITEEELLEIDKLSGYQLENIEKGGRG